MQILENVFNPSTLNIMLDIETTGTRPGCRVLSIGLAYFTAGGVEDSTYILPSIESQLGSDDSSTLEWWKTQTADAKRVFSDNIISGISVRDTAREMKAFIDKCVKTHVSNFNGEDKPRICIWGNGATFDNAILARMFDDNGIDDIPWNTFGDRCYRTLVTALGKVVLRGECGIAHHAADDAIHQANILIATLKNAGK